MKRNDEIQEELNNLKKEYNEYKLYVQSKLIRETDSWRYMFKKGEKRLEFIKSENRALLKLIMDFGLAEKYAERFCDEFYPHDVFDFAPEIEAKIEDVMDKKELYTFLKFQLLKPETLN